MNVTIKHTTGVRLYEGVLSYETKETDDLLVDDMRGFAIRMQR